MERLGAARPRDGRNGGARVSTWVAGAAILAGTVVLSLGGLVAVRRWLPSDLLKEQHDVAAAIFAIVGTIYAVLLAFAVVIVWQAYTETQSIVAQEANALGDLERMSRGFPVVIRREVHEASRTYAHVVITREWPAMADGRSSEQADAQLIKLWHVYTDMQGSVRSSPLYGESLTQLNAITDHRRLRLLASKDRVQPVVWSMLVAGGAIVILFSYLFAVRSFRQQALMTVLLAGVIAFALFLIVALNGPFVGDVKVQPTAFETAIHNMEHVGG
jgi:hypothetical protein